MLAESAYKASSEQRQHVNTVPISKLPCCPCMCFALCHLLPSKAAVCSYGSFCGLHLHLSESPLWLEDTGASPL